ncbi:MAG: bifunctional 2-C-methyl-D-erythritol 4-phosphate cytidylyltransferase/2-C-methyl-D-erythritol 2,4-cyclodiphosphate synthase [Rhodobacteraceae bacterium]|nr:bifunctional 2-C-methyl-D-erythritol 4-phosphate cytidylyltransferase/2-C-methyl-D-erythritol 2,4-cyclodiphosphate synthase [Paracoccaceae bacterium]
MKIVAVVVAAGSGQRAGGGLPKQFRPLGDRPVLAHTLDRVAACPGLGRIALVLGAGQEALFHSHVRPHLSDALAATIRLVKGGADRGASVRAGLDALVPDAPTHVLIHDGARPCLGPDLLARLCMALDGGARGAAPALPVTDALWYGQDGKVADSRPRGGLWRAQTPQAFAFADIRDAHRAAGAAGQSPADDVEVARGAGIDVTIVEGDEDNLKITRPEDFARAARVLADRAGSPGKDRAVVDVRTGTGFDVHAFGPGDHAMLCGIAVPHERGLAGHSDADVGLHALTDALLGALAEGDIGQWFPPSDPRWKGASSDIFLRAAAERARERGFAITHLDVTLICERPKIGPHSAAMRARIAEITGLSPDRVSVKATTTERLGFAGREEGIAALASATLVAGA